MATDRDAAVRSSEQAGRELQHAVGECRSLRREADAAAARLQQVGEEVAEAREEAGRAQAAREVMLLMSQMPPLERHNFSWRTVPWLHHANQHPCDTHSLIGCRGCWDESLLLLQALQGIISGPSCQVQLAKICIQTKS